VLPEKQFVFRFWIEKQTDYCAVFSAQMKTAKEHAKALPGR